MLLPLGLTQYFSLQIPFNHVLPLLLIFAQIVALSLQYLAYFLLQQRGGPVYLSLLGSVGAATDVPVAIFLLGEAPREGSAMDAAFIGIGIFLVSRKPDD